MLDHMHEDVEVEFRWKTCILAGHEAHKAEMCFFPIGFSITGTAISDQAKSACSAADR